MKDPLNILLELYSYDACNIQHAVFGQKYTAVVLKNGNIGVCATLENHIVNNIHQHPDQNLSDLSNRNILIAYFNALLNNEQDHDRNEDIFTAIAFSKYKNIVMTGNFKPLVPKFRQAGITLHVFDRIPGEDVLDMGRHREYLSACDAHILTSTTVFNGSFMDIREATPPSVHSYLLGPSTTMHEMYFTEFGMKALMGTTLGRNNEAALDVIAEGGGTRDFQKFGDKVVLFGSKK